MRAQLSTEELTAILSGIAAILAYVALRSQRQHDRNRLAFDLHRALEETDRAAFGSLSPAEFYLLEAADWSKAFKSDVLLRVSRYFNELDTYALAINEGVIDRRVAKRLTAPLGRLAPQLLQIMRSIEDVYNDERALESARLLIDQHWRALPQDQQVMIADSNAEGISMADIRRAALQLDGSKEPEPFPLLRAEP